MRKIKPIERLDSSDQSFVVSQLKRVGLTATKFRLTVLSTFYNDNPDLSVQEIYQILQHMDSPACLSTVYNAVNHLSRTGILSAFTRVDGTKSYELNYGQHQAQLICMQCGQRQKFTNSLLIEKCKEQASASGFASESFTLCISGICKSCST